MKISQVDLIKQYFVENPNRDIAHPEIVDWVTFEYEKLTGEKFRDPDRSIRKLAQEGFLIKVSKGIYRYEPDAAHKRNLEDFTPSQKKAIFERDGYECARCGKTKKDYPSTEFHIDHLVPKDDGGKAILENGQVLCSRCNFIKKNTKQTATGKKMFVNLYEYAKKEGNEEVKQFCEDLLNVFEKHDINGHIEWKK
ncbi:MAG: HNH endonuclease [Bacteroidetes bacterium]|nr:MAG: HNH endonuclease [Bacteroidota bacterium]TAG89008.1 MAG: HNH endonuclease [Bacteroidota bacterium]